MRFQRHLQNAKGFLKDSNISHDFVQFHYISIDSNEDKLPITLDKFLFAETLKMFVKVLIYYYDIIVTKKIKDKRQRWNKRRQEPEFF